MLPLLDETVTKRFESAWGRLKDHDARVFRPLSRSDVAQPALSFARSARSDGHEIALPKVKLGEAAPSPSENGMRNWKGDLPRYKCSFKQDRQHQGFDIRSCGYHRGGEKQHVHVIVRTPSSQLLPTRDTHVNGRCCNTEDEQEARQVAPAL
ncbi:hypothetical protein BDZ89DRAFT_1035207 [Hymenopellis radicata]|nr:hypothetical protein BDZ89DRAFT_1035207 [Hymenopellis radicata]